MRIELLGPPGSGKSTLAPSLATELSGALIDMGSHRAVSGRLLGSWERRLLTAWALARTPQLTVALLPVLGGSTPAMRGALGLPRRELALSNLKRNEWIIVDEGPIHAASWTLTMSQMPSHAIRGIAQRMSRPDVLISVDAADELIVNRIRSSGDRRLKLASREEVLEAVARYRRVSHELVQVIGAPLIHVNGGPTMDVVDLADHARALSGIPSD